MSMGFWRGIIVGSVMATLAGMIMEPQRKPASSMIPGKSDMRRVKSRADKMVRGVGKTINKMME